VTEGGVERGTPPVVTFRGCSKITEAEAAVSVNEEKWLVMHMHVQLKLDELWGPQTLGSLWHEGAWPVAALVTFGGCWRHQLTACKPACKHVVLFESLVSGEATGAHHCKHDVDC
jgi:hypothetical protein